MIQLDTRCSVSSHHGIPLSVIQEKILGYVQTVPDSETERHRKCTG